MNASIDTQTAQLIAHLRRGGNYSYFWAVSHAKDAKESDETRSRVVTR